MLRLILSLHFTALATVGLVGASASTASALVDPHWPFTEGVADTRFFKPGVASDFLGCVGFALNKAGYPAAPGPLAGPNPYAKIRDCAESTSESYSGSLCAIPTEVTCRSLSYHQSWCGRLEALLSGEGSAWACKETLHAALAGLHALPDAEHLPVALPDAIYGPVAATPHIGEVAMASRLRPNPALHLDLDQKIGLWELAKKAQQNPWWKKALIKKVMPYFYKLKQQQLWAKKFAKKKAWAKAKGKKSSKKKKGAFKKKGASFPKQKQIPKSLDGVKLAKELFLSPTCKNKLQCTAAMEKLRKIVTWTANGAGINSCEEYAYEKYYDFSVWDDFVPSFGSYDDWRRAFDALYLGWNSHPPVVDDDFENDFRDRLGQRIQTGIELPNAPLYASFKWVSEAPEISKAAFLRQELKKQVIQETTSSDPTPLPLVPTPDMLNPPAQVGYKNLAQYVFGSALREEFVEKNPIGVLGQYTRLQERESLAFNYEWHWNKSELFKSLGFEDAHAEDLRAKQDALWNLILERIKLMREFSGILNAMSNQVDQALLEQIRGLGHGPPPEFGGGGPGLPGEGPNGPPNEGLSENPLAEALSQVPEGVGQRLVALRAALEANWEAIQAFKPIFMHPNNNCTAKEATPCDWAPSLLVENLLSHYARHRKQDHTICANYVGSSDFSTPTAADPLGKMKDRFFEADKLLSPVSVKPMYRNGAEVRAYVTNHADALRAHGRAADPTLHPAALEDYLFRLTGYYQALSNYMLDDLDATTHTSTHFAKTNSAGIATVALANDIGLGMETPESDHSPPDWATGEGTDQATPVDQAAVCSEGVDTDASFSLDVELAGVQLDDLYAVELWTVEDGPESGGSPSTGPDAGTSPAGRFITTNFTAQGSFVHEPCAMTYDSERTVMCSTAGLSVSFPSLKLEFGAEWPYQFSIGPIPVVATFGFGVGAAIHGSAGYSLHHEHVSPPPPSGCPTLWRHEFHTSVVPTVYAGAHASMGIGVAGVAEVGLRVDLTLASASLPMTYSIVRDNIEKAFHFIFSGDVVVDLLKGTLSAYIKAIGITWLKIKLVEAVVRRYRHPQWLYKDGEKIDVPDPCWTQEVRHILGGFQTMISDGCPCTIRSPEHCSDGTEGT